ncbi:hypothetical protein BHE90_001813 [Fusarium euwallaceae]|uniref:Glucose-methanol-choline oxidoreductase C-terminal domain-containing protein n=2 Tax=Fusarium solani species complex TaxID=232080 RepID=A0A430M6I4_9HYPO|nr:hypothetical protein CEP51_003265 [Fusarium floridanum]RTE83575.1 hypothetical protein BHE90_001813 [Fusarium euwallaceae]
MDTIYKGRRSGGFLFVRNNPNITILAEVHSKKLVIDEANRECKGVTVIHSSATELSFYTALEAILSQGVFESSKLHMANPGEVTVNSSDPLVQPNINLNFFADDLDIISMREDLKVA